MLNPQVLEFVSLSTGLDNPHDLLFVLTTLRTVTRGGGGLVGWGGVGACRKRKAGGVMTLWGERRARSE